METQKIYHTVKEVNNLLMFIENNALVSESKIMVNSDGISYKYVEYIVKFPKKFAISIFRKAEYALLKTYSKSVLDIDNFNTIYMKQPPFKGCAVEAITLKRLVII